MKKKLISILALSLMVIGCETQAESISKNIFDSDLVGKNFELKTIDRKTTASLGLTRMPTISFLQIDGNLRASGTSGCNRYNGDVYLYNGTFKIENMMLTRMMCSGLEGSVESYLTRTFGEMSKIELIKDELIIYNDGKRFGFKEVYYK